MTAFLHALPGPSSGRFRPEALFRPHSLAVIGAETADGARVLANLRASGFAGPVTAVEGAIADLAAAPDLAVLCGDATQTGAALAALGARGTRAAVVIGGGVGLRDFARQTGVRTLGPRSFGIAVPAIGLNATTGHLAPIAGRIALVSQSAALCRAVIDWAEPNGVGFSHVVGIGGNDDIGFGLVLDWLSRDSGTGTILLDINRIKDPRAFLSAARAAARLRPVVALRAGGRLRDPSGAAEAVFVAALQRCGVLCVAGFDDLLAAAETLTRARPARGAALAIVTNAMGPGQLAADAVLREGLALAELAPETRDVIRLRLPNAFCGVSPDGVAIGDIVYAGRDQMALAEAAALLAGAREVGGVLIVHVPQVAGETVAVEAITAAVRVAKIPLLVCAMGATTAGGHRRRLADAHVPVFTSPEQAVRGFRHLVQDRRNREAARELPPSAVLDLVPDKPDVRRLFRAARARGRLALAQDEAMAVLAAYGVPSVPGRVAMDGADAADAAKLLGFPAVLKRRRMSRPDPGSHGGLVLDVRDEAQMRAAAAMLERRQVGQEGAAGFLVQRQVGRARELRLQVRGDATFGPVIGFGQGGTAADVLGDVAVDLPPLNISLAHGLIARSRAARTLGDLHDQKAANSAAIAGALVRVSQLLIDFPEIAEIDINPLFADADGVLVADAWIGLRPEGEVGVLSIAPYPTELTGSFDARGERLTVRPIRPEDAAAHAAFFARLPAADVRYRFFSALRQLSPEQMARLTQVDYDREMAFVVVRAGADGMEETVGVARLVRETGSAEGEFAIAVQPDMKGSGIARHLMERLIAWARTRGVLELVGQVLADNVPMLAFVRRLGFSVRRVPNELDVMEARLPVAPR